MTSKALPANEVDACIAYWQGKLNLLHWRVSWKTVENSKVPLAIMEIAPKRERTSATIFIKQASYDSFSFCSREFQGYIVHELVHLVLDPIAEEHSLQIEFDVESLKHKESMKRFKRTLEKAVEHMAVQVVAIAPLYDANLTTRQNYIQISEKARAVREDSIQRRANRQ